MANEPLFRFYLQNKAGEYLKAEQNKDNTWNVYPTSIEQGSHLKHLPKEWDQTEIIWERNTTYMGVFRSMSTDYEFAKDGRAIFLGILAARGIQGYARLIIKMRIDTESTPGAMDFWRYETFYSSEINFSESKDNKQTKFFTATTLDSNLYRDLKAYASTQVNIPYWTYDSGVASWLAGNSIFINHDGIKLLYSATFLSGATPSNHLVFDIDAWNNGNHGSGQGQHTLPAMNLYNFIQNNGTTTYIGNDILQSFILQGNQNSVTNEVNFTNVSKPFTNSSYLIKELVFSSDMKISVSGRFTSDITFEAPGDAAYLAFIIFEIDKTDEPPIVSGEYQIFATLLRIDMPAGGVYTPFPSTDGVFNSTPVAATLSPDKVYAFGVIWDNDAGTTSTTNAAWDMSDLQVNFSSAYNSGASSPVQAPSFPASTVIGKRPADLLSAIAPTLASIESDAYGFPIIPTGTPYQGVSTYLSDDTIDPNGNFDNIPNRTIFTSGNAIRIINGQPYISTSVSDFFNICFKVWGCGLGIENDVDGEPNIIRVEPLSYFFDKDTMILDLGNNVASLEIEPLTDFAASNINCGYNAVTTNNDFGVDAFNRDQQRTTPLSNALGKVADLQTTQAVTEMYAIEKMRQQQTNQPISNPSSGNDVVLLEIVASAAFAEEVQDPGGNVVDVIAYGLKKYPTAQNTDPTAATQPYIYNLYYPDTAINMGLTPVSNLLRMGGWLHSIYDGQDDGFLTFRKQYQMLFDNSSIPIPGISKNLGSGLIVETADIPISTLGPKLWRPYKISVTTISPVNMYFVFGTNPRGYIQFRWENVVYKMFIWSVTQKAGNSASTTITGIAHPDTTDAQIYRN